MSIARLPIVAVLAVLAFPAVASSGGGPRDWGPHPTKCAGGVIGASGCYGRDAGPNSMDDAGNGNIDIAPHVIRVGDRLTMTVTGDSQPNWPAEAPGLKIVGSCPNGRLTCTYRGVSRTEGWQRFEMGFGLGAREQDYYGVLPGLTKIEGKVTDSEGAPAAGVAIRAVARRTLTATTGADGTYSIRASPGTYTVRPVSRSTVFIPRARRVTVRSGTTARANFRAGGCRAEASAAKTSLCGQKIEGRLQNRAGGGIEGFPVKITGRATRGGSISRTAVTDHEGNYSTRVPSGRYTIDLSAAAIDNLWRPAAKRDVRVTNGDAGVNFLTTARCGTEEVTRMGTKGRDRIHTGRAERATTVVVAAGGDADDISVPDRPAFVCPGAGTDKVVTGPGDDFVDNQSGADAVFLNRGKDVFRGGGDGETVHGGPGNDDINLFAGADEADGGADDDLILGGTGPDILRGGPGRDSIEGYTGNDRLFAGPGPNLSVVGGPDRDLCELGNGDPRTVARECETISHG